MESYMKSPFKPTILVKILIAYIYFMQGVYLSLTSVVVYLFPVFPSPDVLSNFSMATLPFSFKYITAPIVEKFTILTYGRRKFWITLSLFATSLLTYPLGLIVDSEANYKTTIGILFVIMIFISMGDVAIDAASVIQLEDPVLAGYLQASMQPLGVILGSFLIIKVQNPTFWSFLGIEGPLCSIHTLLTIISLTGFLIACAVHFCYKERVIKDQQLDDIPELKTILKYYIHFINPKYSLCRHVLFFCLLNQGLKFFTINFGTQVIYRGFDKQRIAEMENLIVVVAIIVNTIMSKIITKQKAYNFIIYFYFIQLFSYSILFFANSFDATVVYCTIFFIKLMSYMKFLLHSTLINSFGHSQFAGLCLTTLASFHNLGNNAWLQLKLNAQFGYYCSVSGGLTYAFIAGVCLKWFIQWIKKGEGESVIHEIVKKD